ncbi:hypothetical protein ACKKBG_A21995 [Auxenochlorella protothecoides x Auxenochlorella symbiontica]
MGGCVSTLESAGQATNHALPASNDYELVCRSSKELEHVLTVGFGAQGKGLHEKATYVEQYLSPDLIRKIRYLATIRNKLVHEYDFNSIPNRQQFLNNFHIAQSELQAALRQHGRIQNVPQPSSQFCRVQ